MKKISAEEYILGSGKWIEALNMLRELMLALEMEETVKWSSPVYCVGGKNVLGIGYFKAHVAIWFFQGVFLEDQQKKLMSAMKEDARAMRQWRFYSADEIEEELNILISYVKEAIENSKQGKVIKPIQNKAFVIPDILNMAIANDSNLKQCYNALSYSKRRDYARYIGEAKQKSTQERRLQKCMPLIRQGKGIMDIYKK